MNATSVAAAAEAWNENCSTVRRNLPMPLDMFTWINLIGTLFTFLLGGTLNALMILFTARRQTPQSTPNVLLMNLALSDMIFLLVHTPTHVISTVAASWDNLALCRLAYFSRYTTLGVSVISLVAMSVDRFIAVVFPLRRNYHGNNIGLRGFALLVVIWLVAIFLSVPITVSSQVILSRHPDPHSADPTSCVEFIFCALFERDSTGALTPYAQAMLITFVWLRLVVYFMVPLIIVTVCYAIMAVHLLRPVPGTTTQGNATASGGGGAITSEATTQLLRSRRKLVKIVLALVVAFVLCWLPDHINAFLSVIHNWIHVWLKTTAKILTLFYSCVNPLLICCLSRTYRNFYANSLCGLCCRQAQWSYSMTAQLDLPQRPPPPTACMNKQHRGTLDDCSRYHRNRRSTVEQHLGWDETVAL